MKNVIKKLLSLTLVAALLLCAMPFQALAADTAITVVVVNEEDTELARFEKSPSNGKNASVSNLLNYALKQGLVEGFGPGEVEIASAYAYYADGTKGSVSAGDLLSGGDKVRIKVREAEAADDEDGEQSGEAIAFNVKYLNKKGEKETIFTGSIVPSNGEYAIAKNILTYGWSKTWADKYTVDHCWSSLQQANIGSDTKVYAGDTVSFLLTDSKSNTGSNNNSGSNNSGSTNTGSNDEVDDEFFKEVYLQIFTNDNIKKYTKQLNITDYTMIKDGKVTKDELWSVITKYYKATDSSKGIIWKGMYIENEDVDATNWVEGNYKNVTSVDGLNELRQQGTVIIKVRITGVAAKTTTNNADSTNPKTGDTILAPVAIMVASAAAVAYIYMDSKKRAVR